MAKEMNAGNGAAEPLPRTVSSRELEGPREFLKYTFYKVRPSWRLRPAEERARDKKEFARILEELLRQRAVRLYSLVGIRGDTDFMTWAIADRLEDFTQMARRVSSTGLGRHLEIPFAYLAQRRRSIYLKGHEHTGQDGQGGPRAPAGSKYLFVYPFSKKREWYGLPFEERRRMMGEHFKVGHKYPRITIHTGYSFGLDDQEFVLAFEGDDPGEFLDLVMDLRGSDASKFTALETPTFTCIGVAPAALVDALGD